MLKLKKFLKSDLNVIILFCKLSILFIRYVFVSLFQDWDNLIDIIARFYNRSLRFEFNFRIFLHAELKIMATIISNHYSTQLNRDRWDNLINTIVTRFHNELRFDFNFRIFLLLFLENEPISDKNLKWNFKIIARTIWKSRINVIPRNLIESDIPYIVYEKRIRFIHHRWRIVRRTP